MNFVTVKAITLEEVPRASRKRVSPIKETRDWLQTIEAIRNDKFEALRVEFSDDTLALGKATPDRFRRMLKMEIAMMGRKNLNVTFRGKSPNGAPILYVLRGVVLKDYTKPFPIRKQVRNEEPDERVVPARISASEGAKQALREQDRRISRETRLLHSKESK